MRPHFTSPEQIKKVDNDRIETDDSCSSSHVFYASHIFKNQHFRNAGTFPWPRLTSSVVMSQGRDVIYIYKKKPCNRDQNDISFGFYTSLFLSGILPCSVFFMEKTIKINK